MPSQEEYLDNLLKGIETENTETEVTKEPKMTGTEEETAKAPETPEPVEESGIEVDMIDMDDLLQSALDAQKADSSEQETEASQPVAENTAILPEETASMSEDEINRLLQQSQEQSGDAPAQERLLHLFVNNFYALVVIYGLWGVTSLLTFWPALMKIVRIQASTGK